ncbi:hypothetical protein R8Z50_03820 [Longispora sp. K20-0274]|uniref:hypothetical protein n=1 Tax=Longispora sp. K20-0274 TaxID=3088255 RepID=UPI00399B0931
MNPHEYRVRYRGSELRATVDPAGRTVTFELPCGERPVTVDGEGARAVYALLFAATFGSLGGIGTPAPELDRPSRPRRPPR